METFSLLQLALRLPAVLPAAVLQEIVAVVYRRLTVCEQGAVSDALVASFTRRLRDRDTLRRHLAVARRLAPELEQPVDLAGIQVAVLVAWGREDRMLDHRNAEHVLELTPHARLELLDRVVTVRRSSPARTTALILSLPRAGAGLRR